MCVCPLHFYDKEKLYGHVPTTSEAETKSYIFDQLTRRLTRLLYNKDILIITTGLKTVSLSIDCLFVFLSFCTRCRHRYKYIPTMLPEVHSILYSGLTYHAAAVEHSHIVMDNGAAAAAAAATRYLYLRSRRKEDTLYTQGRLRSICTCMYMYQLCRLGEGVL